MPYWVDTILNCGRKCDERARPQSAANRGDCLFRSSEETIALYIFSTVVPSNGGTTKKRNEVSPETSEWQHVGDAPGMNYLTFVLAPAARGQCRPLAVRPEGADH